MTPAVLAALIRRKTRTNSTTFPDDDMLPDVNVFKDEISKKIAEARPEEFNVTETDDLAADTRLYAFKAEVMNNLVRLELKFSSSGNYVLAVPSKLAQTGIPMQESIIVTYYTNEEPEYFIRGKHIYILSYTITAVTAGIRWVYKIWPADLANLTGSTDISVDASATSLGFPKEFHELLARRVSIEYKDRNKIRLSSREARYDVDLEKALEEYATPVSTEAIIATVPSSADRGDDDGYNL